MSESSQFVTLTLGSQETSIEYQWLNAENTQAPLMIFLHEGLGSVAMWKQFPQQLCNALRCQGLVYSRPGYGRSSPRLADEKWGVGFMHQQAYEVLPSLLETLEVITNINPPWLFGHSDGGSIALLYAAKYPGRLAGAKSKISIYCLTCVLLLLSVQVNTYVKQPVPKPHYHTKLSSNTHHSY